MTHQSSRNGFTLTEVLIVVAIGVVLTASGFLSLNSFRNRKDVEFSMLEVTAVVRETRERSVTQKDGFGWGIRFISTSTGDIYKVFQGSSYASGTTTATHSFRRPVEFGEPAGNRIVDILFNPISGKVSTRKIITVAPKSSRSYVGDIIVNTQGLVTQRMEDGIVGYWHFDEGTGTSTYDASSNGNTGTLTNSPTWQSGSSCKAGGCLYFDGDNDYISIPDDKSLRANTTDQMSFSMWVKSNDYTNDQAFIAKRHTNNNAGHYLIQTQFSGKILFAWYTGQSPAGSAYYRTNDVVLTAGQWHHIGITKVWSDSSPDFHIYVDGVEKSFTAVNPTRLASNYTGDYVPSSIGAARRAEGYGGNYALFKGFIDEVRVYNVVLSSSTIKAHYDDLK